MTATFRNHWPEYLMEAAGLGAFMLSACLGTALLFHPASPVVSLIAGPNVRRLLMGLAMGATAFAIIQSPWGRRSGAHINPAVTLTFARLGKIAPADAAFYILAQFLGGWAGVMLARVLLGSAIMHPSVAYAVTVPGPRGPGPAFVAEAAISFLTMTVVLFMTNRPALAPRTGLAVSVLVCGYVFFESPVSGFGMNPARSLASAWPSGVWSSFWLYAITPPLGMLAAAQAYGALSRAYQPRCAKLLHCPRCRCIFCGYEPPPADRPGSAVGPA